MVFTDGAPGQPLVRLQCDGHELTFDVPFEVGSPVVYGSTLEYRDVLDGVDLIVTANEDGTGFSEVLPVELEQQYWAQYAATTPAEVTAGAR